MRRLTAKADARLLASPAEIEVDGLRVWFQFLRDPKAPVMRAHIRQALKLISTFDPMRFARIKRDLAGIIVSDLPIPIWPMGTFAEETRTCHLVAARLLAAGKGAPLVAAMMIVHEATHARLFRFGFDADTLRDERCRIRQERMCKAAELAFLQRFPKSDLIQDHVRRELDAVPVTYATHTIYERRADTFGHLGLPRPVALWLARRLNPLNEPSAAERRVVPGDDRAS
jgi:hypothetical protein